jgi:hypothetical protein
MTEEASRRVGGSLQRNLAGNPELNMFLQAATAISSAANPAAKMAQVNAFLNLVESQFGRALNAAQALELSELAQAI